MGSPQQSRSRSDSTNVPGLHKGASPSRQPVPLNQKRKRALPSSKPNSLPIASSTEQNTEPTQPVDLLPKPGFTPMSLPVAKRPRLSDDSSSRPIAELQAESSSGDSTLSSLAAAAAALARARASVHEEIGSTAGLQRQIKIYETTLAEMRRTMEASKNEWESKHKKVVASHVTEITAKDATIIELNAQRVSLENRLQGKSTELGQLKIKQDAQQKTIDKLEQEDIGYEKDIAKIRDEQTQHVKLLEDEFESKQKILKDRLEDVHDEKRRYSQSVEELSHILPEVQSRITTITSNLETAQQLRRSISSDYDDLSRNEVLSRLRELGCQLETAKAAATKASNSSQHAPRMLASSPKANQAISKNPRPQGNSASDPPKRRYTANARSTRTSSVSRSSVAEFSANNPNMGSRGVGAQAQVNARKPPTTKFPEGLVARVYQHQYCHQYHLENKCTRHDECPFFHGPQLDTEQLDALRFLQQTPLRERIKFGASKKY